MNEAEQLVADKYISDGWSVIKDGAPDLILLKDGKIKFVEVKYSTDPTLMQKRAIALLLKNGFDAEIIRVRGKVPKGESFVIVSFKNGMWFFDWSRDGTPTRRDLLHMIDTQLVSYEKFGVWWHRKE